MSDSDASPARPRRGAGDRAVDDAAVVDSGSSSDSDSSDSDVEKSKKKGKKGKNGHGLIMTNGQSVGLVRKEDISKQNAELKAKERAKFEEATADSLGKGQETVYRDKKGKRLETLEAFMKGGDGGAAKEQAAEEENMEWGKGLVQNRNKQSDAQRLESMKDAPFARYADDKDMNDDLKTIDRWGDPMLKMMGGSGKGAGGGGNKANQRPKCKFNAPTNRFNIPPGYRWDGVVRTSGFENKLLGQAKEHEAKDEARYKWAVEDM